MLFVNYTSKEKERRRKDGTKKKRQNSYSKYKTQRNKNRDSPKTTKSTHKIIVVLTLTAIKYF